MPLRLSSTVITAFLALAHCAAPPAANAQPQAGEAGTQAPDPVVRDGSEAPRIVSFSPAPASRIVDNIGVHTLEIGFSDHIVIPDGSVRVWGVSNGEISFDDHFYDPQSRLLTIELDRSVLADVLTVVVDYTIVSSSDRVPLDGELGSPGSIQIPSGNGVPGGRAVVRYEILQGDANRDGVVDMEDAYLIVASLGSSVGEPGYDPLADLNADGVINALDLGIWSAANGASLPVINDIPPVVESITPDPDGFVDGDIAEIVVAYSAPLDPNFVDPRDLFVSTPAGQSFEANTVSLSMDGRFATFGFGPPLSQCERYTLNLSQSIADPSGALAVVPQVSPEISGLNPTPPPSIGSHQSTTSQTSITLGGTAQNAASVEFTGPGGQAAAPVVDGVYTIDAPLAANTVNNLFITAISACGTRSAPTVTQVIMDAQPPNLFIDFPADGAEIQSDRTDVAGRVSDLHSGFQGLSVLVNGVPAEVDIGIGTNGTFFLPNFELNTSGTTVIEAVATDSLGNTRTRSISVSRVQIPPDAPRFELISGNGQSGSVHRYLDDPVIVRVTRADGSPIENKVVTFTVTRSDGILSETPGSSGGLTYQVLTDSSGIAEAWWRMGGDAGCGNNRLEVTSRDIAGTVMLCATATPGPASQINIGTGNSQRGETGSSLPLPLRVYVNDACNGIADLPVEFTVVQGDGMFTNGEPTITVPTATTGHAEVGFTLGQTPGANRVQATFQGNPNAPAEFVLTGLERDPDRSSSFTGLILDNASQPVDGAEVRLVINGVEIGVTTSNIEGQFGFSGFEASGMTDLYVDGSVATGVGGPKNYQPVDPFSFPGLHFETVVVANAANSLGMPILLPRMNPNNVRTYSTTEQTILESEGMEGLRMIIEPGSMTMPDGTPAQNGQIMALNQVHHDDIPMPMPDGAAPPFAWTVFPPEATFDPPIKVEYPNMSGLAPGAVAYFLTFDHATGKFEIVSSGTVTPDGSTIVTDPGSGLTLSGWGCNCPPYSVTGECCLATPAECYECQDGEIVPSPAGTPCDDGDPCTTNDVCNAGLCEGELPTNICSATIPANPVPVGPWTSGRTGSSRNAAWADDFDIQWGVCFDTSTNQWSARVNSIGIEGQVEWNINQLPAAGSCSHGSGSLQEVIIAGAGSNINQANYCEIASDLSRELNTLAMCWHSTQALAVHELYHRDTDIPATAAPHVSAVQTTIESLTVSCGPGITEAQVRAALEPQVNAAKISLLQQFRSEFATFARLHNRPSGRPPSANGAYIASYTQVLQPMISTINQIAAQNNWGPACFVPTAYHDDDDEFIDPIIAIEVDPEIIIGDPGDIINITVTAVLADGSRIDITKDPDVVLAVVEQQIAQVTNDRQVIALQPGFATLSVQLCQADRCLPYSAYVPITIRRPNDFDIDGIPDDWEIANGLDPTDSDDALLDFDSDGLINLEEYLAGTDPWNPDTDGDGVSDWEEILLGTDPLRGPRFDDGWSIQIGGQSNGVGSGAFRVSNIAAPDLFGPGGPGTAPDFLSDDFIRVTGTAEIDGQTWYAFSDPFQIRQGETLEVSDLTITDIPPPLPESITLGVADGFSPVVEVGQQTQMATTATLGDGSTLDVTPRAAWTTYRTSNPAAATVDQDGLVTAHARGPAFITAVNESATATRRISVTEMAVTTTLTGLVQLDDGSPAAGAEIIALPFGKMGTAGADGLFSFEIQVPSKAIAVTVRAMLGDSVGANADITLVPGGFTDGGVVVLFPPSSGPLFPGPKHAAGDSPVSVIMGDLDRDGDLDMVIANSGTFGGGDDLSVLLNNGDGTFSPHIRYAAGNLPASVALGDLNGDSHLDMAVANVGSDDTSVLINNGDGTFAPQTRYVARDGPQSVALGDLDGDGNLDMVVSNSLAGQISVRLGNGDGTFASLVSYAAGNRPASVALGDLNGDGNIDMALANFNSDDTSLLLGNGDGTFTPQTRFAAGSRPTSVALGDLDGDSYLDMAVANRASGDVSVLLNDGNGTFATQTRYTVGSSPESVAVGDLNGDGNLDMAVANIGADTSVLLGRGDGSFEPQTRYETGDQPYSVSMGDMNGDGALDLSVVDRLSDAVYVLLNIGNGTFPTRQDIATGSRPLSVAMGNLDDDGVADLITANYGSSTVSMLPGNGDGTFADQLESFIIYSEATSLAIGDLNGDDIPDLAVGFDNSNFVSVLWGLGNGLFIPLTSIPADLGGERFVSIVDLNADGLFDIVFSNSDHDNVSVVLGNGDGTFADRRDYRVDENPLSVAIGDLNADSEPDIVVANWGSDSVSVRLGNGDGTFQPRRTFGTGIGPRSVAIGDLDGDGTPDLGVTNTDSDTISVLVGNGDGTFQPRQDFDTNSSPHSVAVADLDGDGTPDLAVANRDSSTVSVLLGSGDGTFRIRQDFSVGESPHSLMIGDLDGDGTPDLAIANFDSDTVSVLLNQRNLGRSSRLLAENGVPGLIPLRSPALTPVSPLRLTGSGASRPTMAGIKPISPWADLIRDPARNSAGQSLVARRDADGRQFAAILEPGGTMTPLGTLGGQRSVALAINDAGQVVGWSETADGAIHAFRYTPGEGMLDLGTLGGPLSAGVALNAGGDVAGFSVTPTEAEHPFLFADEYGMVDLGVLPNMHHARGLAINADSTMIAGTAYGPLASDRAVLWTRESGVFDLNELLPPESPWHLLSADGFDETGAIIGLGLLEGKQQHFRLEVRPEPPIHPVDTNADGRIDELELLSFLELLASGDPAADINEDGSIDHHDLREVMDSVGVSAE